MFKRFIQGYLIVALVFWCLTIFIFHNNFSFFSLIFIAFILGLRHGFDADHIVAIDNVTRQFASEKKYFISIGTYFALGHSSIVLLMTVLLIFGITIFKSQSSMIMTSGAYIGACASIIFLWLTALMNLAFMVKVQKSKSMFDKQSSGFLFKLTKPLKQSINKPYKMYFVGFIFGLGFDTATEIALLGLAASSYISGTSTAFILFLPLAFALGMALVDSLSAAIMAKLIYWVNNNEHYYRIYQLLISGFAFIISVLLGVFEFLNLFDIKLNKLINNMTFLVSEYSEWFGFSIFLVFLSLSLFILMQYKKASHKKEKPILF